MGRLRVGAAVGTGEGTEERVDALVEAGVDVIVVDTAHGHSQGVLERVRWVKQNYPERAGDRRQHRHRRRPRKALRRRRRRRASRSASARARSAPRAWSPASACRRSPRSPTSPRRCEGSGVPRDRRRRHPLLRRYRQGARRRRALRHDRLPARRHRRSARARSNSIQGRSYKSYRGMGSLGAMARGLERPLFPGRRQERREAGARRHRRPRAVQGQRCVDIMHQLMGGLRASMGYTGCATIDRDARQGRVRARSPTPASARSTCTTCRSPRKRRTTVSIVAGVRTQGQRAAAGSS